MTLTMVLIVYHAAITALVFFLLGHTLINLLVFRRPCPATAMGVPDPETVSVLIPARNEARRIGPCLESLCQSRNPAQEIIVLDDHSNDATSDVVAQFAARDPRVRCVTGKALPEGWTGKAWACHQLAAQATGSLLVFTDADTVHHPDSIADIATTFPNRRADVLSLWPYQITASWGEKLVVPFVHVLLLVFLPHWMPGRWRSLGAANGQCIAFRRRAYDALGGHQAVRHHLVEDVALARLARAAGLRMINADGSKRVRCRMYESMPQIWEGFSKNLRAGCDGSVAAFILLQGVQAIAFLLPFFWLLVGLATGAAWTGAVVVQLFLIFLLRTVLALRVGQSFWSVLGHPIGQVLELAIALNSWRAFSKGAVTWKQRTYPTGSH
ncbi:MAG: glycosyltransferase [Candidatus Methylacidiphilales bacterium]